MYLRGVHRLEIGGGTARRGVGEADRASHRSTLPFLSGYIGVNERHS